MGSQSECYTGLTYDNIIKFASALAAMVDRCCDSCAARAWIKEMASLDRSDFQKQRGADKQSIRQPSDPIRWRS